MATGQYRSALSFDDVVQKSILAGSTLQNNFERISKPLEEQCGEVVPLVSLRFRGVKIIDVIEESRPPKNSVAFEPGDLEVDFVCIFSIFLRAIFQFLVRGEGSRGAPLGARQQGSQRMSRDTCELLPLWRNSFSS